MRQLQDTTDATADTSMFTQSAAGQPSRLHRLVRSCCAQIAQLLPPEVSPAIILYALTLQRVSAALIGCSVFVWRNDKGGVGHRF
eukprot:2217712-Rhodomonas_salina.4